MTGPLKKVGGKRKGRPPKSELGPSTSILTLRLRPEIYEDIRREAELNARSISAQAEMRLLQSGETNEVGRMVGRIVDTVEKRTGKKHFLSKGVRAQCRSAIDFYADAYFGEAPSRTEIIQEVARKLALLKGALEHGRSALASLQNPMPTNEEIEFELASLDDLVLGHQVAADLMREFLESEKDREEQ